MAAVVGGQIDAVGLVVGGDDDAAAIENERRFPPPWSVEKKGCS
jgi:hypothetical protein